ncbi:hypothetical protein HJFPF1_10638 [Paramyrothecium foliicola]|nr:hypothetical protein HJFPF1_10638 [Paramyrothecium foliicola]
MSDRTDTTVSVAADLVKPPREFKFVGTYSRKRRRRAPHASKTASKASTTSTEESTAINVATELPSKSLSRPPKSPSHQDEFQAATNQQGPPPSDSESGGLHAKQVPAVSYGQPVPEDAEQEVDVNRFTDSMDWAYGGLMNPFIDLGANFLPPIDQFGHAHQIPLSFDPELNLMHLGDSSSTDSPSNADIGAYQLNIQEAAEPSIVDPEDGEYDVDNRRKDEIVLPPLQKNRGPCNISQTITQLLNRYDQEFCVLPLTHDFDGNPFRFDSETGRGSQLLLNSILALSYKHIYRDTGTCGYEAKVHKKKAVQMLKDAESSSELSPIGVSFLDAVLILMTLDCASSAHGPWVWYLKRAYKMIHASQSSDAPKTPRMQARMEMLVWWDVTLALTSRQGCVLTESTISNLLNPGNNGNDNTTFYSVSGCPEDLFKQMIRLGAYAREFELVATMTCVKFDMEPVLAVEKSIREWSNPEFDDVCGSQYLRERLSYDSEEPLHYKEDLHHCAEAWRYALLLYIERVFKWERGQCPLPILGLLARRILNHMSACRRSSMVQKQLLLPVFLAGCETKDENLRQEARLYCTWWSEKTRYDMFLTAVGLLEEVWSKEDPLAWWGSIMDEKSRANAGSSNPRQYLFG